MITVLFNVISLRLHKNALYLWVYVIKHQAIREICVILHIFSCWGQGKKKRKLALKFREINLLNSQKKIFL